MIGTLAAAAAVAAIAFTPPVREKIDFYRTGGASSLVAASESMQMRTVEGRLSGGHPYRELKPTLRSGNEAADPEMWPLLAAANEVELPRTERDDASARRLHATGVSELMRGEHDQAIATLEGALRAAGGSDARILSDLAAAHLEAARFRSSPEHARLARERIDRAWALDRTPEIAWNRALAYEQTAPADAARAAWSDYLALDSTSPWATEAREAHQSGEK